MAKITWTSTAGGDWNTASNWSGGVVPGASSDVFVTLPGSYAITISDSEAAHSLTLNDTDATITVSGTLAIGGKLNLLAGQFVLNGSIVGGTIVDASGVLVLSSGGTLNGVAYDGTLNESGYGVNGYIAGGIALAGANGAGAGTLNLTGNYAVLNIADATTLDNATVNIGANGSYFTLGQYSVSANPALTFGSHLVLNQIDATSLSASGAGIVNNGTINSLSTRYTGFQIYGSSFTNNGSLLVNGGNTTITTNAFSNAGAIAVSNGGSLYVAGGNVANTGSIGVSNATLNASQSNLTLTGAIEVDANGTLLLENDANIATITSKVTLSGANSTIEWYSTATNAEVTLDPSLSAIAAGASFSVLGGRNFTVTANGGRFTDSGFLGLGGGVFTAAGLIVAARGTLAGAGIIKGPVNSAGTIEAMGGRLKVGPGLSSKGKVKIDAGATLEIGGKTAANVTFAGVGATLTLDTPGGFTGSLIAAAGGDYLDVVGFVASGVSVAGGNLVLSNTKQSLTYHLVNPTEAGVQIASDGHGGTLVSFTTAVIGPTYYLPLGPTTIVAPIGNDTFVAVGGALNSRDNLTGGAGALNTLELSGGGLFDLNAPKTLANIQVVSATEGQAATSTVAGAQPSVVLRDGASVTLNVAGAVSNPANPNPSGILIYGAADASVINLGPGADTVVLGSATETVIGGGGIALVQATAGFAGAAVEGAGSGTTTLEITTGGAITLNDATTFTAVRLDAASHLTLNKMAFISAIGLVSGNTIAAGGVGQSLGGAAGSDTLVGYSGFGDTFRGAAAGLNGDTIQTFGGVGGLADKLDITDLSPAATLGYVDGGSQGMLTLNDGMHSLSLTMVGSFSQSGFQIATDGHSGSFVTYV